MLATFQSTMDAKAMIRLLFLLLVALGLAIALPAGSAMAQIGQKAYAPEDLRRLSVPDRIRVLEREYEEQSRGRRLPDDQLDFYLDQIESGWSFSRIKQDIAESLGGGAWVPPSSGWNAREVICSSDRGRLRECRTPFTGPAILSQQISDSACVEGHSWGQRRGLIWVDKGCRGRFRQDDRWSGGGYPGGSHANSVVCESREGRVRRCQTNFRFDAELAEQFSNAPCIRGQTWDSRPGEVWVSRGCRARFVEGRSGGGSFPGGAGGGFGSGYSVTCSSEDGRQRTCAWTDRGRPFLLEQLSRTPCTEGRTWGYDRGNIWVSQGCRGRFGVR
jgi:hypothetical protein